MVLLTTLLYAAHEAQEGLAEPRRPREIEAARERVEGECAARHVLPEPHRFCDVERGRAMPVDYAQMDAERDPCADFYGFACGRAPEGGVFSEMSRYVQRSVDQVLANKVAERQQPYADFVSACLADGGRGDSDLLPYMLASVARGATSVERLLAMWGRLQWYDVPLPLTMHFETDPRNASRAVVAISHVFPTWNVSARVSRLLSDAVPPPPVDLQRFLREGEFLQQGDWATRFGLQSFLEGACDPAYLQCESWLHDVAAMPAWIQSPEFVRTLRERLAARPLSEWVELTKNLLQRHMRDECHGHFRPHAYGADFPWQRRARTPCALPSDRATHCNARTKTLFSEQLAYDFRESWTSESERAAFSALTETLQKTFVAAVGDSPFLSRHERDTLRQRLRGVRVVQGGSEVPPPDRCAHARYADWVLCRRQSAIAQHYRQAGAAQTRFDDAGTEASAFFRHATQTVHVGAGLLHFPFVGPPEDRAAVFARLGSVVAHEFAHSVDQKALGEIIGNLTGVAAFADCLRGLYSTAPRQNGAPSLNENFADVLGFNVAYRAFLASSATPPDRQQRRAFFVAAAQIHCDGEERGLQTERAVGDSHSPSFLRGSVPQRNHPDFGRLWNCPSAASRKQCLLVH